MKITSPLGLVLFYFGLMVAAVGFFIDKADNIPGALNILAPSYVRAKDGLDTLQEAGSLVPGQRGFSELEALFWHQVEAKGVRYQLAFQEVKKFERKTAMLQFNEARAGVEVVPVDVQLTSGLVGWNITGLREATEELRRSSLLRSSTLIFVLGIATTIAGKLLEDRYKRLNTTLQPANVADLPGST